MKKKISIFMAALSFAVASGSVFADLPNDQACLLSSKRRIEKIRIRDADYVIKVCTAAIQNWTRTEWNISRAYMGRAGAWYAKKDYDKALADASQAISADPKMPGYLIFRADVSVLLKNYDQALDDYSSALALYPSWNKNGQAEVYTKRGAVYGLMGRLDGAISDLNTATKLDPKGARAYYNRGLAWELKGDHAQAIQDYQNALDANPADPHSFMSRGADWEQKNTAGKAATLYQDISFSTEMDTTGGDIRVAGIQKTRFGNALLVSAEGMPANAILFDGKKVFEDELGMYVSMCGYFQSKDTDVILVSSNPGGSATPDSSMSFLVIRSASQVQVLSDPGFVADTPNTDELKKWMDKDGRIFVKLGFRAGDEIVAELDSGKLVIHANSRKGVPLADDLCHWLYDNGMESCQSTIAHEQGCSKYANPAGIYSSVSDMSQLTYISNQPGYSQIGFNKACLAWCNDKAVSYQQFSKTTCGVK